jgi:hypothetical protein
MEPNLYINPATGDSAWVHFGHPHPEGWKPFIPRLTPPPNTDSNREYFNPQTGESYIFGPAQIPPPDWKKLQPVPPQDPRNPYAMISWIPGKEPRLYVDPETGKSQWVSYGDKPPDGWKPLRPRFTPPPQTDNKGEFFNPETGDSYNFGPDQEPPPGWKKLQPVPPQDPRNPYVMISWIPGKEPRLYVDPETGTSQWVSYGDKPADGWRPLNPLWAPPAATRQLREYFSPRTGETYQFGATEEPPSDWKKLGPVPAPVTGLPVGSVATAALGMAPRLFVDPATGTPSWVFGGDLPPESWKPPWPGLGAPPNTSFTRAYFNPKTGEMFIFGPDQDPPGDWKKLQPFPALATDLPPGIAFDWAWGNAPRLFADAETGVPNWLAHGVDPPPGWQLLKPSQPMAQLRWLNPNWNDFLAVDPFGLGPVGAPGRPLVAQMDQAIPAERIPALVRAGWRPPWALGYCWCRSRRP